jgi:hypothetical protein
MIRATMVSLLICAAVLAVSQPVSAQVREAWERVRAFTIETKDAALEDGRKLLREADAKIKQLEDKASQSSGDAKASYERSVADAKVKRAQAANKLDEMGKATGSAWDSTKNGFADAYKDLHESVDKATK